MTRGGGKPRSKGMDQLDWLTKVVKNKASPDSSAIQSRVGSMTRADMRAPSSEGRGDWISLKDEVVLVNRMFPRPRINFEKASLLFDPEVWLTDITDRSQSSSSDHVDERSMGKRRSHGLHTYTLVLPSILSLRQRVSDIRDGA